MSLPPAGPRAAGGRQWESAPVPAHESRTNAQRLADAGDLHQLQMRRAARTVTNAVADPADREELLACLGLLDVQGPVAG